MITRVGDREVHDADDLVNALRAEEGRVSLSVVRHGTHRTIEADLGKADQRVIRIRGGDGMLGFRGDGRMRAPMSGVERGPVPFGQAPWRQPLRSLPRRIVEVLGVF